MTPPPRHLALVRDGLPFPCPACGRPTRQLLSLAFTDPPRELAACPECAPLQRDLQRYAGPLLAW